MNQDFIGDFLGFTYNGTHSSELGIVRVTTGDREEDSLLPNIKDNTTEIPGSDGLYFFNSVYQQNQFNISFAYDDVRETDIRNMRRLFGDKNIHDLIFDEEPYKVYSVKPSGTAPRLTYLCFDNDEHTERIYKGEGSMQLVAYYPYARAQYKTWSEYVVTTINGRHYDKNGVCIEEWAPTSGLLQSLSGYDTFVNGLATLYNPGDIESPLSMIMEVLTQEKVQISYSISEVAITKMIIDTSKLTVGNRYRINSKIKLIEGGTYNNGVFTPNGLVHNDCILAGDFFYSQPTSSPQKIDSSSTAIISLSNIQYDYLYF